MTHGATVASAPVVVLANGADALRLWPGAGWPIGQARGQLSLWPAPGPSAPALPLPLAGEGYALRQRGGALLCGATVAHGDDEPALRERDHRFNVDRLSRLTGWRPDDELPWQGRVGWRVQTPDRLPIVGPVAAVTAATLMHGGATRMSSVLREPGLFVLTALGSRGLTWAPLAGEVVAAWASGTPMPLEARLRDAIDPARWVLRAARRQR